MIKCPSSENLAAWLRPLSSAPMMSYIYVLVPVLLFNFTIACLHALASPIYTLILNCELCEDENRLCTTQPGAQINLSVKIHIFLKGKSNYKLIFSPAKTFKNSHPNWLCLNNILAPQYRC